MAEKNLVEEAVIQLKNLEEAINENAKEILESTMKQEISELVKESLNEANEDEMDFEDSEEESDEEMGSEDESEEESDEEESEEEDFEDEESDDEDSDEEFEFDDEEESPEVMDFTAMDNSPETHDLLMTVFKKMKPEDEVEITKDGDYVNLKDGEEEYLLSVNESEEEEDDDDEDFESELEETIYEIAMDGDDYDEESLEDDGETNETIYELHMDDEDEPSEYDEELPDAPEEERPGGMFYEGDMDEEYQEEEYMHESKIGYLEFSNGFKKDSHQGKKSTVKPVLGKGVKPGKNAADIGWHKNEDLSVGGFKTVKKPANLTKGTGKPKFEYKESTKKMSKGEFKEAARTLGNGSKFRHGGLPKPRAHSKANANMKENYELMEEVQMLRAKNEEYRKALNLFRDKLNEVAVFNSNLAYTTRLFTEHSTSKQEKINILRRFDSAETLKESKNLYKSIKDELSSSNKGNINESFERVIDNEPVTGSAQSLIESKTYENPQFMRMKDLMTKIIK